MPQAPSGLPTQGHFSAEAVPPALRTPEWGGRPVRPRPRQAPVFCSQNTPPRGGSLTWQMASCAPRRTRVLQANTAHGPRGAPRNDRSVASAWCRPRRPEGPRRERARLGPLACGSGSPPTDAPLRGGSSAGVVSARVLGVFLEKKHKIGSRPLFAQHEQKNHFELLHQLFCCLCPCLEPLGFRIVNLETCEQ